MDFSHFWNFRRISMGFSKRIQTLLLSFTQKIGNNSPLKAPVHSRILFKKWLGVASMVSSLFLGYWANQLSETAAIEKWEKAYLPSREVVHFALGSRNLKQPKDQRQIQRILRSLPQRLDDGGSFWISQDSNWVTYYATSEEQTDPQIHCLNCSPSAIPNSSFNLWQPAGLGWRGLEKILEKIDLKIKNTPRTTQKNRFFRDPRELVY
jgi:hypothetical protein